MTEMDDEMRQDIEEAIAPIGVSIDEIRGKRRHPDFIRGRTAAVVLLRETYELSYPKIGRLLNMSHSSAIDLYKRRDEDRTHFKRWETHDADV